jgi:hypothetical protein
LLEILRHERIFFSSSLIFLVSHPLLARLNDAHARRAIHNASATGDFGYHSLILRGSSS